MANQMIARSFNGVTIQQRTTDSYMNATAMCQACGKRWNNYARNETTEEYLAELAAVTQISATELVEVRQGGT